MEFGQDRLSYSLKKKKKILDEYNKRNEIIIEKGTYPLDKDSPSHQYREEMDPCLPQQGFLPKTSR